ncbi:PRTRC system ParB family protein [Acidovorax delafieldii]|uniref:PRTRC system ParB family protein n=1 Tax=Acidovorax delafieldii TaxID=47920 RepID=UPI003ED102D6
MDTQTLDRPQATPVHSTKANYPEWLNNLIHNGQPCLPYHLIDLGDNPRKKLGGIEDMAESIRAQGLLQPVLVRPKGDGRFELVAGYRRFTAYGIAFSGTEDLPIPVTIRALDGAMVESAALTENVQREAMTPLDEAESAARLLVHCKGDRAETALFLGLKLPTLNARLALMYCTEDVRAALREDKIKLGHAELLAGLRKESQAQGLQTLLTVTPQPTVNEMRAMLERAALALDSAIFDKTDCAGCQHNSGHQQALFGVAISGANCTNKTCYDEKTANRIDQQAQALKEEFQVVRIVRPGENFTITALHPTGPKGVGEAQAAACRSCENFGAAVSALPDTLGRVFKNQCLDTQCNTRMVAKRIRTENEAAAAAAEATKGASEGKTSGTTAGKTQAGKTEAKKDDDASPKSFSRAVTEYREKVWRDVFRTVVASAPAQINRCVLLAVVLTRPSNIDEHALTKATADVLTTTTISSAEGKLKSLLGLPAESLSKALNEIAANLTTMTPISSISGMLSLLNVNLEDHWRLNEEFLNLLTKNELDALCVELALKPLIDDYPKQVAGKKGDFIKAMLGIKDFDYTALVPKSMRW